MLHQHHPLVGREIAIAKAVPLVIRPAADTVRFSLRIDPAERSQASAIFGLNLPAKIGELSASGEKRALCLGPDEWYLTAPLAEQDALEAAFAELYLKVIHSLVDIGHREVGIQIEGKNALLALQSAVPFDIASMPVGSGCRTIFDRAQVILLRNDENSFRIEVWRSFADHVWGILQAAGREIELGI